MGGPWGHSASCLKIRTTLIQRFAGAIEHLGPASKCTLKRQSTYLLKNVPCVGGTWTGLDTIWSTCFPEAGLPAGEALAFGRGERGLSLWEHVGGQRAASESMGVGRGWGQEHPPRPPSKMGRFLHSCPHMTPQSPGPSWSHRLGPWTLLRRSVQPTERVPSGIKAGTNFSQN